MEKIEKIDLIRERLGVSYERANQALEEANGDVVEALIKLEKEDVKSGGFSFNPFTNTKESINVKGQELIGKIKELVKEGNINKIVVKNDDKTLLEIPVTAGVVSLVIFPYLTLLAGLAAMYKDYSLEISRNDQKKENN